MRTRDEARHPENPGSFLRIRRRNHTRSRLSNTPHFTPEVIQPSPSRIHLRHNTESHGFVHGFFSSSSLTITSHEVYNHTPRIPALSRLIRPSTLHPHQIEYMRTYLHISLHIPNISFTVLVIETFGLSIDCEQIYGRLRSLIGIRQTAIDRFD